MLRKRSKLVLYASPIFVGIILLQIFFDVRVPHSLDTYFEVNPLQKWVLAKGTEGQIFSSIVDYKLAISNTFTVVQFERGESMNFTLAQSIQSKSFINKGDTIGIINSTSLQERLTQLGGSLLVAKADLAAKSTGEKQALIDEAKNKLAYTEAEIQQKTLTYERMEELHNRGYISQGEYEIYLWDLKQLKILREVNKAQLEALTTGSKSEELQILRSTIDSYIKEIRLLKSRLDDFVLTAPIAGEVAKYVSRDTLLKVNNTSQIILTAPVRYSDSRALTEGQTVKLSLRGFPDEITGQLVSISREITILNGVQILYSRILLDSPDKSLVPGLLVGGEIILPKITVKEYMFSLLRN